MRKFLALGLMFGLAIMVGCDQPAPVVPAKVLVPAPTGNGGPAIGEAAPEIVGVDLEGVEFKLSDYSGKVVMLHFYGDW